MASQNNTSLYQELLKLQGEDTRGFSEPGGAFLSTDSQCKTMVLLGLRRGNGKTIPPPPATHVDRQTRHLGLSPFRAVAPGSRSSSVALPVSLGLRGPSNHLAILALLHLHHLCCQQFLCSALCQGGCWRLSAAASQGGEFHALRAPDSLRVKRKPHRTHAPGSLVQTELMLCLIEAPCRRGVTR